MVSSQFFEADGLRFHFRTTGAGIPFVFQHGLGGDATQTFDYCVPPAGVRLLTLDCRGHGETTPLGPEERLSIPQFVDDLRAFLDRLQLDQIIVGGISMGAAVALEFTLRFPERVLGLVLSRPAWLDEVRENDFQVFGRIAGLIRRYGAFEGALRFQKSVEFEQIRRGSPDNARSVLGQFSHPRAAETVAKLEQIPRYRPTSPRSTWCGIRVPTLVLGNRLDVIHPYEFALEYARRIPGAEGHEITPKSVNATQHTSEHRRWLAEFLSAHWGASDSVRGEPPVGPPDGA